MNRLPFSVVIPNHTIQSQNTRERCHWATRKRDNDRCLLLLRSAVNTNADGYHDNHRRKVHILSVRRRKITDKANLEGGCKGLIDCLTRAKIIVDDADQWVDITYEQKTGGRETIITVEDLP